MNYVLCEADHNGRDAGAKARADIATILIDNSWTPLRLRMHWGEGNLGGKLVALKDNILDWRRLSRKLHSGDTMLMQFPIAMFPKVSMTAVPYLRRIHEKGARCIALVHDLDSLRGFPAPLEEAFLPYADVIIVHNDYMAEHLSHFGFTDKLVTLEVFDYLTDCPMIDPVTRGIDIAGNLKPEKAGYVYELGREFPDAAFNLYGPNYATGHESDMWYRGTFPPSVLPGEMKGAFGLIWDGDSTATCSGIYGEYLRYNNPHKLSLYLACGKPVLIWDQAAEAHFVESRQVGLAVSSIGEALARVSTLSMGEYEHMQSNARKLGEALRNGHFTMRAVGKARELLD